jgi:hypothetical protein
MSFAAIATNMNRSVPITRDFFYPVTIPPSEFCGAATDQRKVPAIDGLFVEWIPDTLKTEAFKISDIGCREFNDPLAPQTQRCASIVNPPPPEIGSFRMRPELVVQLGVIRTEAQQRPLRMLPISLNDLHCCTLRQRLGEHSRVSEQGVELCQYQFTKIPMQISFNRLNDAPD